MNIHWLGGVLIDATNATGQRLSDLQMFASVVSSMSSVGVLAMLYFVEVNSIRELLRVQRWPILVWVLIAIWLVGPFALLPFFGAYIPSFFVTAYLYGFLDPVDEHTDCGCHR